MYCQRSCWIAFCSQKWSWAKDTDFLKIYFFCLKHMYIDEVNDCRSRKTTTCLSILRVAVVKCTAVRLNSLCLYVRANEMFIIAKKESEKYFHAIWPWCSWSSFFNVLQHSGYYTYQLLQLSKIFFYFCMSFRIRSDLLRKQHGLFR